MTLREALQQANFDEVCKLINKKDSKNVAKCDRPTLEQTRLAYKKVICELLSKPKTRSYTMHWLVQDNTDPFDKKPYVDVCFLNPKYVEPPKGTKPWGGKNPPVGHYNCNLNKYNRTFAAGFTPWSKIIDTPIVNEGNYSLNQLVAEILWEITFYGWTEEKVEENVNIIQEKIIDSAKGITKK